MAQATASKTLALGLQGGGSHAAFTWGVLDRLLDAVASGSLRIAAISGTSGGALNGAVCVYGMLEGPEQAKRLLKQFWDAVSSESLWPFEPYRMLLPKTSAARWNVDWSPVAIGLGMAEQIYSPYWNPWPGNVIGQIVEAIIADFGRLNAGSDGVPKLFVGATKVNDTALRIFGPGEISAKALMASSCYPTLFPAVEIDGCFYWDGGYMGNPALNPLLDYAEDLLTVLIDPLTVAGGPPVSPRQIVNRINEVSFNASWVLEMQQIELINQLVRQQLLTTGKYRIKRFHVIRDDRLMETVGASSKQNPSRDFIYYLHDAGHQAADHWICRHMQDIGVKSSFSMETEIAARLKG